MGKPVDSNGNEMCDQDELTKRKSEDKTMGPTNHAIDYLDPFYKWQSAVRTTFGL